MKLDDLLTVLNQVAPERLAGDWDQVGLHLAGDKKRVRRAMLCIDLTPPVLEEAIQHKCQLIVAYHPPIFSPLRRLADRDWRETMLARAIRSGIAVYSPHSSLDAVREGMNDWLCDGLGKHSVRWSLGVAKDYKTYRYKIIVDVPPANADYLRKAMWSAGAGDIGDYSECSFTHRGVGTFQGGRGSQPAIGKAGRRETLDEMRIEMICGRTNLGEVLHQIRATHPYEEPAIGVLELKAEPSPEGQEEGPGRCHRLLRPISASTLIRRVKAHLGLKRLKAAIPGTYGSAELPNKIESIAVCVGAGGSLFDNYLSADAYITGEMRHHQVLDMVQRGKVIILAGHTNTERPFLSDYRESIVAKGGARVQWIISTEDRAPLAIV